MGHNLDVSGGAPAMAYVGEVPWHGLGEKLPENQPIGAWVKAAKLDWTLDRIPVQYLVRGYLQAMSDRFVLVRSDTGEGLSVVSGDYNPVHPPEVLEFYRTLVDRYGYTLETAGALDNGRKVWALARTGAVGEVGEGDPLVGYLLLATSCDKSLATTATFTSVRVVCQNTLSFAFTDLKKHRRRHVKVPHTKRFLPEDVHSELGLLDEAWEKYLRDVRRMASRAMPPTGAMAFFEGLLKTRDDKPLSQPAQRELLTLMTLLKSAPGQDLQTTNGTIWGAINAVTYYVDHLRKSNSGERLNSAWFGAGDLLKDKAWLAAERLLGN